MTKSTATIINSLTTSAVANKINEAQARREAVARRKAIEAMRAERQAAYDAARAKHGELSSEYLAASDKLDALDLELSQLELKWGVL